MNNQLHGSWLTSVFPRVHYLLIVLITQVQNQLSWPAPDNKIAQSVLARPSRSNIRKRNTTNRLENRLHYAKWTENYRSALHNKWVTFLLCKDRGQNSLVGVVLVMVGVTKGWRHTPRADCVMPRVDAPTASVRERTSYSVILVSIHFCYYSICFCFRNFCVRFANLRHCVCVRSFYNSIILLVFSTALYFVPRFMSLMK